MRRHCGTIAACVLLLLSLNTASGQRQNQRGQDNRERLTTAGVVKGYSRGLLYIMTKEGDQYRVKLPNRGDSISYVGSAAPQFLKRGMLVKFTAKFDAKGRVVAPVRDITIFTPTKEDKIGIYADSGLGGGAKDLFSDVDTTKPEPQGKPYSVSGSIARARSGKLTISAGRTSVQIELDEAARVSVDVAHLQFMQPGDNVSIEGWYNPAQKRDVVANRITVSAGQKLGEPKKPAANE